MLATILAAAPWKPEFWLEKAGGSAAWVVTAIIFAECGLFVGFFLPGDSLLFLSGFMTSSGADKFTQVGESGHALRAVYTGMPSLWVLLICFYVAAVAGDQVGYWFGRKVGPALFTRQDSRLFKQSHVTRAHEFLEKNGSKTIIMARFVPVVRTFSPIVCGVGKLKYRTFLMYDLVGALLWAVGVTVLGAVLGNVGVVRDHIEIAILGVIFISISPALFELYKSRKHVAAAVAEATETTPVDDAV